MALPATRVKVGLIREPLPRHALAVTPAVSALPSVAPALGTTFGMGIESARPALVAQSAYYLATGLLPFVSRRAFEAVTGPKREWWLVQTTGALVTVIGGALGSAALRRRITPEVLALATGSAAALGAIDAVYVARRRIAPTYLLDAAVQAALLVAIGRLLAERLGAGDGAVMLGQFVTPH